MTSERYQKIYAAVRRIPRGRVCTYGEIAALAGMPRQPRVVGYALYALPAGSTVPWHRVINARGMVSLRGAIRGSDLPQRLRLEREGVAFDARGKISLARFGWPAAARRRAGCVPAGTRPERGGRS
ncbi:MAG TPA: methylated-DNA--[protein]-cysteine S-methyltransferase [Gemmatimonadaceae bacterium]|nr:methylated-DNA--[protein]-cysteine S-methyltransferase [Gemmatimonadaceae bacterium]